MKFKIIVFLFILGFLSCSDEYETVEVKHENGTIAEQYTRRKVDFAKEGVYKKFDDQGNLLEEANYSNDTLDGLRVIYFANGKHQVEEHYVKGQFEGPFKSFHEDGNLKLEGVYENNKMTGPWKAYYENGQLKEIVQFEANQENGPFIEYYENGNLKAKGSYLEGDHEHGELELYDESGVLVRKMMCDKGICRTTWEKDSKEDENL
ncbi:MAG: toxin-antitoxin system YwqK family antitoxin [Saprospiraceae bacterium]